MKTLKPYQRELRAIHHRRVYYIILVSGLMILLFAGLDSIIAPQFFPTFSLYSILSFCCCLVLLGFNYRDNRHRVPFPIGFAAFIIITLTLLAIIYQMGGITSPYYVGLIVILVLYTALAPLTMSQTLISGLVLTSGYIATIVLAQNTGPLLFIDYFSNLFFMVCFVLIAAIQSWADTAARQHGFQLRAQENNAAQELSRQAEILEQEVDKRTRKQNASEIRYRFLFNQIADDIVVIAADGSLIQSNESFDLHFLHDHLAKPFFFDFITDPQQQGLIQKSFAEILINGEPISACKLQLKRNNGSIADVEINASLVQRQGEKIGILIVIRDITPRKILEKRLVESLLIKKQTETATILALAKLSEYRDVTPGNHLERVREYCKILAEELSKQKDFADTITPEYIQDIYNASILHDIGKVAIPDELLNRQSALTEQEKNTIRTHTLVGGDVIKEMEQENQDDGFLKMAKHIAYFHHERWDGKGYPYGLQDREIPLSARIMSLADAYEEMTTIPDQGSQDLSHEQVVESITKNSGIHFDPILVQAFLTRQDDFNAIRCSYPES